jgi:hypothetical protein
MAGGQETGCLIKEQLGLEMSVNNQAEYRQLFKGLLSGKINAMDESRKKPGEKKR